MRLHVPGKGTTSGGMNVLRFFTEVLIPGDVLPCEVELVWHLSGDEPALASRVETAAPEACFLSQTAEAPMLMNHFNSIAAGYCLVVHVGLSGSKDGGGDLMQRMSRIAALKGIFGRRAELMKMIAPTICNEG